MGKEKEERSIAGEILSFLLYVVVVVGDDVPDYSLCGTENLRERQVPWRIR